MANTTYGTGSALQFASGEQRQVLELGSKIHYYNPSVTPLLTLMGRMSTVVTPVPIFEWMEDEYMIKKSIKQDIITEGADSATVNVTDTATGGINGHNSVVKFDKQAALEMFEVGGLYAASVAGGSAAIHTDITHFICVAIGEKVNITSATSRHVQFIGCHVKSSDATVYQVEQVADGTDMITVDAAGVLTLTYVGTAGTYDGGANFGAQGLFQAETAFVDDKEFNLEGGLGTYAEGAAIGEETRKRVRRLKNCTQIFREPYSITGTADASQHYGGSELARLQARKLAKIKSDIEFALLTNGDISLDPTSENPKRTFAGFGIGGSAGAGVIKSLDGRGDSNLQLDFNAAGLDEMDAAVEYIFSDMMEGSMEKTVLCSNKWLRFITALGRQGIGPTGTPVASNGATLNIDSGIANATAGLQVTKYQGPVGVLNFVPHPMLKGAYEDFALAVDMANVDLRPLASRDMQLRSDVVNDGRDARVDEWLMEVGCEIRNEQTHAILKLT
tara:strand:- start:8417 stop:9925 length:1509 start_codon:yes stop_codon:yes gene_type:complete